MVGLKPRVVVTGPFESSEALKRIWLDIFEKAGARRVFLVEYGMACAVGLGLDVVGSEVRGLLAMESDWSQFVVISYADVLFRVTLAL